MMHSKKRDAMLPTSPGTHACGRVLVRSSDLLYALPTSETGNKAGMVEVYETLLKVGKAKKTCQACNRHMDDRELAIFEKYVRFRGCLTWFAKVGR